MIRSDFSYISADGHTTIHAVKWLPDSAPTAVIQIAHGITEHVGRYDDFADFFHKPRLRRRRKRPPRARSVD